MITGVLDWKPDFRYYEELAAIECENREDFEKIFNAFRNKELRACPHDFEVGGFAVIIPKSAVVFLPLSEIKHTQVELREVRYLEDNVQTELRRRFNERGAKKKHPHYYVCGNVCLWAFVPLKTIEEIRRKLGKK